MADDDKSTACAGLVRNYNLLSVFADISCILLTAFHYAFVIETCSHFQEVSALKVRTVRGCLALNRLAQLC